VSVLRGDLILDLVMRSGSEPFQNISFEIFERVQKACHGKPSHDFHHALPERADARNTKKLTSKCNKFKKYINLLFFYGKFGKINLCSLKPI
jgi:hypothetical protein